MGAPRTITYDKTLTREEIAAAVPTDMCRTRYGTDNRVVQDGSGGVWVTRSTGVTYHVVDDGCAGWCIRDPLGKTARFNLGEALAGFATANDAISCLIGGPRS